jgi:hypothetical protein
MSATRQLGSFSLRSNKMVITDPGYDEGVAKDVGFGCFVASCTMGDWRVELTEDMSPYRQYPVPRTLLAGLDGFPLSQDLEGWKRVGNEIGGDTGMIGVFDSSHFHDVSVVPGGRQWTYEGGPSDPSDLWYSFVCETIRDKVATLIPYGFVVSWDGGMDVDVFYSETRVVAIRLSISGWPDRI